MENIKEIENIEVEPAIEELKTQILLGIEMPVQEYDYLMCEQSNGKELKVVNGKVVAVERVITEEEKAQARINELRRWFDTEYTKQEQKYRRLRTLNKLCDDGSNPETKLLELYNMAEEKRLEIKRLGG